jgi:hypothetical protein
MRTRVSQQDICIDRRDFHGVNLLGHPHGTNLGGDAGAGSAAYHQRSDHRTRFFEQRKDNDLWKERLASKSGQAIAHLKR